MKGLLEEENAGWRINQARALTPRLWLKVFSNKDLAVKDYHQWDYLITALDIKTRLDRIQSVVLRLLFWKAQIATFLGGSSRPAMALISVFTWHLDHNLLHCLYRRRKIKCGQLKRDWIDTASRPAHVPADWRPHDLDMHPMCVPPVAPPCRSGSLV